MTRRALFGFLLSFAVAFAAEPELIIHHGNIVSLDAKGTTSQAIAIRDQKILALGTNDDILKLKGPKTTLIDAKGQMVLPGLCDSHVHPTGAALSEFKELLPEWKSLTAIFDYIKKKTATTKEGEWIVVRYAFPTRLDEARFPTKAELDAIAPRHPVLYHAGPAGVCNSMALKVSGVTKDTPNPSAGQVVKDAKTGEPTGMLRNAYGVLKGVPGEDPTATRDDKLKGLKKLFALYNEHGLTSIADRNGSRGDLDLYLELKKRGELTVRVNASRGFSPSGTREQIAKRLQELPGADGLGGPTNTGDEWIKIGPIKTFLDGGMLNGTAYMRQPFPQGPTYQVTEDNYRGLLFVKQEQMRLVVEEAVKQKWQVTAHCAGEAGMDELLDAYEFVNRTTPIKDLRLCITHANFPSKNNLERCQKLGVVADVQPVWLYKDGTTLVNALGKERCRWFQPYRSWLKHTTIGGGSDHMLRFDALASTNPWSPWLGIATTIHRTTERGTIIEADEALSREEALKLYTINNAYILHDEKIKGTLEVGKLADLIIIDRDILKCPVKDIATTKVQTTVLGGKVVFQRP